MKAKIETKKELKNKVEECYSFYIEFECGLNFYHCKKLSSSDGKVIYMREHIYKFMFHTYEFDKFITAVWGKIKRGGKISKLTIK